MLITFWSINVLQLQNRLKNLEGQFSPAMLKGGLAYIRNLKTYSVNADEYEAAMGQGDCAW